MTSPLPLYSTHRKALELCVYCPKLCRSVCPVSNAEPREDLLPGNKMATAYEVGRRAIPLDAESAQSAWACTGCMACRQRCDHSNEVADTLFEARQQWFERGAAPAAARAWVSQYHQYRQALERAAAATRQRNEDHIRSGGVPLILGTAYLRHLPDACDAAVESFATLLDTKVDLLAEDGGLILRETGDGPALAEAQARLRVALEGRRRVAVLEPATALQLQSEMGLEVILLVDLAAARLDRLTPLQQAPSGPVRYHDPCKLGRGLGRYRQPRAILTHLLGRPNAEFEYSGEDAKCSGAGGLLPLTMPAQSKAIGSARLEEHERAGGGQIVTACAGSLRRFRKLGANVSDLSTWIVRGLRGGA